MDTSAEKPAKPHNHWCRSSGRTALVLITCFALVCFVGVFFERGTRSARLIEAAYMGNATSVEALITKGVDIHARDGWNSTALMYAAGNGHIDIVKLLLNNGAPIDERSRMHRTPLMWAAQSGNMAVTRFLIEQGADPNLTDNDGEMASDLANKNGHLKVVAYLNSVSPR